MRHLQQNGFVLRNQMLQGQMLRHAVRRQKVPLRQMRHHGLPDEVQNFLS